MTDNYLLSITDRAGNENHISVTIEIKIAEYEKWDYTLDDSNNTITLNYYIGTDKDVIVYPKYCIGDKEYQTRINNNKDINGHKNYMFSKNKNISSVIFKQGLDTSNVTSMNYMFNGCSFLTSLDLSSFDTSNVTNMYGMFQGCSLLTVLDLSSFDTSNVKNMSYMFFDCSKLTAIYVNENTWKEPVSSLLRDNMFYNCSVSEVTYKDIA